MDIKHIQLDDDNPGVSVTGYVLDDSPEMLKGTPRPAVIICPGGGYFSCSDREAEPVAMRFASLGYHAFVLRYTTYASGGLQMPDLSKPLPPKPGVQHPRQIRELGRTFLLLREHAQEWHIDVNRIAVAGFSAGGHVAGLYATVFDEPVLTDYLHASADELRPAAAILGYALTDFSTQMQDVEAKGNPMDIAFMKASYTAFMGASDPGDDRLCEVSPVCHVDGRTPSMFIWATATDPLVSPRQSIEMADALARNGVSYELHIFDEGPHGLSLATQTSSESRSQIFPHVATWFDECATWLGKSFALDLPEESEFERMIGHKR